MTQRQPAVDPARTALLVMDYQAGILDRLAERDSLLTRAAEAIAVVRQHGGTIGYVRVAFEDADLAALPPHSAMAAAVAARGAALHSASPSTAVHQRVAPQADDIVVRKTRVGAFSTTDLDRQLRGAGINTLLLAGLSTSGVVLSTVRDAADRDFRIVVLADACADPDPGVHAFLLDKVFPRQAQVATVADLDSLLGAPAATGA
jgi:nicotinamidase-related amidase